MGIDGAKDVQAIACDTDGAEGLVDNTGAIITPDTLARGGGRARPRSLAERT